MLVLHLKKGSLFSTFLLTRRTNLLLSKKKRSNSREEKFSVFSILRDPVFGLSEKVSRLFHSCRLSEGKRVFRTRWPTRTRDVLGKDISILHLHTEATQGVRRDTPAAGGDR